jgi:hypothetical protein
VIEVERAWIADSRRQRNAAQTADGASEPAGLALSGGGYRSAQFSFGVLQGLAQCGLLRGIDYLSSVGGGGYAASWLLSVTARSGFEAAQERLQSGREQLPRTPSSRTALIRNIAGMSVALVLFLLGVVGVAAELLRVQVPLTPAVVGAVVAWPAAVGALGFGLFALLHSRPFSLHAFMRDQVAKTSLDRKDTLLRDIGRGSPYPLFGAALVHQREREGADGVTPYVLSPLFEGRSGSYTRTTSVETLADAVALSGPTPDREPMRLPDFFKGLLNAHEGPRRGLVEGSHSDPLGIYTLIERRCAFIIACDATDDPGRTFDALASAIRACRHDLGAEIQITLGPLGAAGTEILRHYQFGSIRYSNGSTGLLLYVKPAITGDESVDVRQYATVRRDFPNSGERGQWDDAAAETYRRLGQHSIETLAQEVKGSGGWTRIPIAEAFRDIRLQLRPDLTPGSTTVVDEKVPQELIDAIASGECVLCAGAGLAAQAGLPTWPALFEGLLRMARERSLLDEVAVSELAQSIGTGDLEEAGDELTHQIPEESRSAYLTSVLSSAAESEAHQLLADMPFLGAVNTSLDDVVARAFHGRPLVATDSEELVSLLQSRGRFVANVSGSTAQPASIVLNARQFKVGLERHSQFKQFLTTLFLRYHTFFVGSNIDGIRGFFDALTLSRRPERRQFALIAHEGQIDPVKIRYLDRTYNVQVIEYEPRFNFEGFGDYIRAVRKVVPGARPSTERHSAVAPILKTLILENIGPFESLTLDMTPTWNLLLGDNGKGKTVILRAIAAALCGEQADPTAVARLLRAGTTEGRITLKVETREYSVRLVRGADGRARIGTGTLSPLASDRWLAIGFPALRSVPWENPAGPAELSTKAPNADDLLPLLRGLPDGRISNIKQWIVNLEFAGRTAVIQRFFDVLQALTPGLRISYEGVNRDTMDVQVRTESGAVVPLSAVSQGTGSVMCWVGTLIQRMSEAGLEPDGRALVLIDEIDAHMHPKWQQLFTGAFRQHFKHVQVIVTSHSPLLVSSLTKDEIWLTRSAPLVSEIYGIAHVTEQTDGTTEVHVKGPEPDEDDRAAAPDERRYVARKGVPIIVRDGEIVEAGEPLTKDDVRVTAERIEIPAEGWRVDQILTLPYFGLESTRDPRTAQAIEDFTKLSVKADLSDTEQTRLDDAAALLQVRAPAPHETAAAREAFQLINEFATERLRQLPEEERAKVMSEVQVQIIESTTGSRRPM